MSNVLIGIIGVILFIGLALAGALILGDDFRSASSSSRAAALMSQIKQASDAAMMFKLKTGAGQVPSIETGFLVPRFLKVAANNPTAQDSPAPSSYWYAPHFNNNLYVDGYREPTLAAKYIVAPIGVVGDAKAKDVCQSISETYGLSAIQDFSNNSDPSPANEAGCAIVATPIASSPAWYTAYQRVSPPNMSTSLPSGWTGG